MPVCSSTPWGCCEPANPTNVGDLADAVAVARVCLNRASRRCSLSWRTDVGVECTYKSQEFTAVGGRQPSSPTAEGQSSCLSRQMTASQLSGASSASRPDTTGVGNSSRKAASSASPRFPVGSTPFLSHLQMGNCSLGCMHEQPAGLPRAWRAWQQS